VPSTLIADQNSQGIRQLLSQSGSLKFLIEFPENEKVFESVTQATTIFLYGKGTNVDSFKLSVGLNTAILPPETSAVLSWKEIRNLFGDSLTLPLVKTEEEFNLIKHIYKNSKSLDLYADCYQGDINLTTHKANLRNTPTKNLLVRGDHISNYEVNLSLLNTDRRWFDNPGSVLLSKKDRIVCQQVANMGLRKRLNAGVVPKEVVVANSANCIEVKTPDLQMLTLLGLLNSNLMNWMFKKTSTNNHVNVYELNQLPIKLFPEEEVKRFDSFVNEVIQVKATGKNSTKDTSNISKIESEINAMVYRLYSLTTEQIELLELNV
jgi:Alw26I/Eco31I/Esp3I family type II restriction m6 adenine DNA methyltransferase